MSGINDTIQTLEMLRAEMTRAQTALAQATKHAADARRTSAEFNCVAGRDAFALLSRALDELRNAHHGWIPDAERIAAKAIESLRS